MPRGSRLEIKGIGGLVFIVAIGVLLLAVGLPYLADILSAAASSRGEKKSGNSRKTPHTAGALGLTTSSPHSSDSPPTPQSKESYNDPKDSNPAGPPPETNEATTEPRRRAEILPNDVVDDRRDMPNKLAAHQLPEPTLLPSRLSEKVIRSDAESTTADNAGIPLARCMCRRGRCALLLSNVVVVVRDEWNGTTAVIHLLGRHRSDTKLLEDLLQVVAGCDTLLYWRFAPFQVVVSSDPPPKWYEVDAAAVTMDPLTYVFPEFAAHDLFASLILGSFQLWNLHREVIGHIAEWSGADRNGGGSPYLTDRKALTNITILPFKDRSPNPRFVWPSADPVQAATMDKDISELYSETFWPIAFFDPQIGVSQKNVSFLRTAHADESSGLRAVFSKYVVIGSWSDTTMLSRNQLLKESSIKGRGPQLRSWAAHARNWARTLVCSPAVDTHGLCSHPQRVVVSPGVSTATLSTISETFCPGLEKEGVIRGAKECISQPSFDLGSGDAAGQLKKLLAVVSTQRTVFLSSAVAGLPLHIFAPPKATWFVLKDTAAVNVEAPLFANFAVAGYLMRARLFQVDVLGSRDWPAAVKQMYGSRLRFPENQIEMSDFLTSTAETIDSPPSQISSKKGRHSIACVCRRPDNKYCSLVSHGFPVSFVNSVNEGVWTRAVYIVLPPDASIDQSDVVKVVRKCGDDAKLGWDRKKLDVKVFDPLAPMPMRRRVPKDDLLLRTKMKCGTNSSFNGDTGMTLVWRIFAGFNPYHSIFGPAGHLAVGSTLTLLKRWLSFSAHASSKISTTPTSLWTLFDEHPPQLAAKDRPFVEEIADYFSQVDERFDTTTSQIYTSCAKTHVIGMWQDAPDRPYEKNPHWDWWWFNEGAEVTVDNLLKRYGEPDPTAYSAFGILPRNFTGRSKAQLRARGFSATLLKMFNDTFSRELDAPGEISILGYNVSGRDQFHMLRSRKLILAAEGASVAYAFMCRPGTTWIVTDRHEVGRERKGPNWYPHWFFHTYPSLHSANIRIIFVDIEANNVPSMLQILAAYRKPFVPGVDWVSNAGFQAPE